MPTGNDSLRVTFILPDGSRRAVETSPGRSVLDIAQRAGIGLEGTCEGALSCCTCHIVVQADDFDRLAPASDEEDDMLDLARGVTATSRLGCQIVMVQELDGLTVTVPDGTPVAAVPDGTPITPSEHSG